MDTILVIQPRIAGGKVAKTPEEIVLDLAKEIEEKLPKLMNKKKGHKETFRMKTETQMISLGVFVGQEVDRFNKLLSVMKRSLSDLQEAIKGTVVMSLDLEHMFNNFLDNKVPLLWENVAYLSLKPLSSWVVDLRERVAFVSDWLYNGPPKSYWLPSFFFPQGFMTATLQTYARDTQKAIDTLKFRNHLMDFFEDDIKEVPEEGVNIHGLFLEGAKWDLKKGILVESDPKIPIVKLPVIQLEPVEDRREKDDEKNYWCPLYKTSVRAGELSTTGHSTNYVLPLTLASTEHYKHWRRRGAAMLCMTDD